MTTLTLMTYNIRHGQGMDNRWDLSRSIAVARKYNLDVLCLQEVDRHTSRSFGADEPAMMGHILAPMWHWAFVKSFDYDTGEYGNAILSREASLSTVRCPLPGKNEPRSVIACEFASCAVATLHASLHDEPRLQSVDSVVRLSRTFGDKPFFVTGDWNARPDSEFLTAMREHFAILSDTSVMTIPSDKPKACIDYIAVDKAHAADIRVLETFVADEPLASDHRPVVARIAIDRKP